MFTEVEDIAAIVSKGSVSLWNQSVDLLCLNVSIKLNEFSLSSGIGGVILSIEGSSGCWVEFVNYVASGSIGFWDQSLYLLWLLVGVKALLTQILLAVVGGVSRCMCPFVGLNLLWCRIWI